MIKIFLVLGFCFSSMDAFSKVDKPHFIKGEILVKYKSSLSAAAQINSIEREGAKRITKLTNKGWNRVKLQADKDLQTAIDDFKNDPNVEYAQPNYIYHKLSTIPDDALFGQQWGLKNTAQTVTASVSGLDQPRSDNNPGVARKDMGLQYAWDKITNCSSVIVAVVDTGINYDQDDLAANMWDGGLTYPKHGYNFADSNNDPKDNNGHGTHVAGTIGAVGNNSIGTTGVCWGVKLMAVKVLDAAGSGTTASVISGVNFAVDNGAKVINMSIGGGVFDAAYSTAVSYAQTNNVLVVAAAGNESANNENVSTPTYPCNFTQSNVVCVAALTQNYSLATYSNYGATSVDVGAPGTNILNTWAGFSSKLTSTLANGWNFATNGAAAWGYKSLNFTIGGATVAKSCLVNPPNFNYSSAMYANNINATAWKSFNLTPYNAAVLNFSALYDLSSNDYFSVYAKSGTLDPGPTGTLMDSYTGSSAGSADPISVNISSFIGGTSSIGFNLETNASGVDTGVALFDFSIDTLVFANSNYNVISGTSMATPHVTGLAAMLFALNPNYTYADVAASIKNGGVATASLSGKTSTGKAASAIGSVNYINKPTGGAAVKLP